MTRRILLALLGFTAALLLAAVVPLGVAATAHDRDEYRNSTMAAARSLATAAEEDLADQAGPLNLSRYMRGTGIDGAVVVDRAGRVVGTSGATVPEARALLAAALQGRSTTAWADREENRVLVAATPIGSAASPIVGAIAVSRSSTPLDDRLHRLWLRLVGVSLSAALVAAALAVALARWVARPVRDLQSAAVRLGDGALDVRAPASSGPPEVRRLATAFNAMAGRLEALVHGSRAVVADVSHQLRTPLAAIRLRLELLREEEDQPVSPDLQAALGEVDRLSRLVDGMLAVARAENTTGEAATVDVTALVEGRIEAWSPLAEERGVELSARITDTPLAAATPGHLEQVLDNLLANALDVLGERGHVRLRAGQDNGVVRITVADDGPGMPAERRAAAFHRFVTDRADGRGTGLGLAIVHRLVTADGGQVSLEETPGGGLTVVVELPAAA